MPGKGTNAVAAFAAILIALQLGACGGGSDTTKATTEAVAESPEPDSGARANAWNHVNAPIREDILEFGKVGTEAKLEEAAVVLRAYLVARRAGNYAKACSYLSEYMLSVMEGSAKQQGKHGCVAGLAGLASLSTAEEVEGPVQIDPKIIRSGSEGKRSFLIYEDNFGDTYAMLMRHEGDTWNIQGFEPTRLS
jgi:hypothetical protein